MGYIKQIVVLILTAVIFCASKQNNNMDFPQEIAAVYFQKTNAKEGQVRTVVIFILSSINRLRKELC
jgi:hypothetical protein